MSVRVRAPLAAVNRNWLCWLVISLSAATSLPVLAQRSPTGSFKEFPLPNPGSGPTTIAVAPDGAPHGTINYKPGEDVFASWAY